MTACAPVIIVSPPRSFCPDLGDEFERKSGYPQTKPYEWWRRHDEYENA